ncbi:hypothetical protein FCI23_14345 [Actinacidiphila oryziradicis]|uniref:DUF2171 domain-containing protein n=1 Tax=Actinacidiphila oryziradicis TaxID=2571141 RepID=A0A4U0SRP5_9ACTN|nr:hypothetical protein FCI23_14345 [Actinacidiphila oryziradicis]
MSAPYVPVVGTLAVDTEQNRVGKVTALDGETVTLKPPAGGEEWEALCVRPADESERLHARVAESNARSRGAL